MCVAVHKINWLQKSIDLSVLLIYYSPPAYFEWIYDCYGKGRLQFAPPRMFQSIVRNSYFVINFQLLVVISVLQM